MLRKIYRRFVPRVHFDQEKNIYIQRKAKSVNSELEGDNYLRTGVRLINSHLGLGSYISENSHLRQVNIGRYTCIGPNVKNGFWLHPSKDFVSIHPAFYSTQGQAGFRFTKVQKFKEMKFVDEEKNLINIIGSDVWIGAHVLIMPGVIIGDGAIVATGSVVTKSVLPYTVVGGVPAKFIRFRFNLEDRQFLMETKWWLWEKNRIAGAVNHFENIESLRMYLKGG